MKNAKRIFGITAILALTVCSFTWSGGVEEAVRSARDRGIFGGNSSVPDSPGESGSAEPKTLTITGNTDRSGRVLCYVIDEEKNEYVAFGQKTIADGAITFSLMDCETDMTTPWTGSGSYNVELWFDWDGAIFSYMDDKTWAQLGISEYEDKYKAPKYDFQSASSTIEFSKFRDQLEWHN